MTQKMQKITMFKCRFCGKLFFTEDKHRCKFDPEMRNCFTCDHLIGIEEKQHIVYEPFEKITKEYLVKSVICECSIGQDLAEISQKRWKMDCPDYKIMDGGRQGKEAYMSRIYKSRSNKDLS